MTSSAGVLGVTSSAEPMDESHAFNLSDPEAYFAAKVAADRVVDELDDQHSTLEELAEFLGVEETIDPRVLDMGRASRA